MYLYITLHMWKAIYMLDSSHPYRIHGMLYFQGHFTQGPKCQVPSSTHVNKFHHGGKVPTFEPQEPIEVWSMSNFDCFL